MTGYAQARSQAPGGAAEGWALRVSVKSVNHRFLDLKLQLPEGFDVYETRVRRVIRERIVRGHVHLIVNFEAQSAAGVQLNQPLVEAYLRAAEDLRQKTRAATGMDVVGLLRLPGVIRGAGPALPEDEDEREKLWQILDACLQEALTTLDGMRRAEGVHLVENLRQRLATIGEHCGKVRDLAEVLRPAFARRLDLRLKELLGGTGIDLVGWRKKLRAACRTQRYQRRIRAPAKPLAAIRGAARWRGRSRKKTGFPAARNATRSQHHAFQDSWNRKRSAGHHRTGVGN